MQSIITKINRKIKEELYTISYNMGFYKPQVSHPQKLILAYHGVDLFGNTSLNSRFIKKTYFEQQLLYFKKHFDIVSLKQFFEMEGEPKNFTIALSFDDGYLNNFKYVYPLLEKHEIPATFFVTGIQDTGQDILWTDFIDLIHQCYEAPVEIGGVLYEKNRKGAYFSKEQKQTLKERCLNSDFPFLQSMMTAFPKEALNFKKEKKQSDYWSLMGNREILECSKSPYITIGCHSYYHTDLSKIPFDNAILELEKSKTYLENIIQKEVEELAYPFGNYKPKLVEKANEMGFSRQLALGYSSSYRAPYLQNRFGLNPYVSWANQLRYLLKANYS